MRLGGRGTRTVVAMAVALLIAGAAESLPAMASTDTVSDPARAAAVQAVLDRVLGPGGSTVVVVDTIRTSASTATTVRYGTGAVAASSSDRTTFGGIGSSRSSSVQDLVGGTTSTVATPSGTLVDRTVSVAVDRPRLAAIGLPALRRLVTAAGGVVGSRGDRVSIVVARFAAPVASVPAPPSWQSVLLPYAAPGGGVLAALVLILLLGLAARRRGARARA